MKTTHTSLRVFGSSCFTVSALAIAQALLLSGCATLEESRNAEQLNQNEMQNLRVEVNALKDRVKGVEAANERLVSELESAKSANTKEIVDTRDQVTQLERSLRAMEVASEKDKKELVDSMSKTIADLINRNQPSGSSKSSRPTVATASGNEHVVEAGETLTQIARKYGVTVEALMKANNLSEGKIRSGQKLVITK